MSTQFVGVLAKKNEKSYKYMILGSVLCLLSCVVIGPMPGIPMDPLVSCFLVGNSNLKSNLIMLFKVIFFFLKIGVSFGRSIWLIIISQIISGLGFGFIFVLSFDDAVKEAM